MAHRRPLVLNHILRRPKRQQRRLALRVAEDLNLRLPDSAVAEVDEYVGSFCGLVDDAAAVAEEDVVAVVGPFAGRVGGVFGCETNSGAVAKVEGDEWLSEGAGA